MSLLPALLFVVIAAVASLILIVAISALFPKHRIWPPPKKDGWQQALSWTAFAVSMLGVPLVGVLDFQSLGEGSWVRFVVGAAAVVAGFGIDVWGTKTLTAQQSLGGKGKIIAEGPYKYTRNPQYVGFILIYAGLILVTYSWMALAAGLLLISAFLILPFSEEPWLREEYGKAFEDYAKTVPRFVGMRTFKSKASSS